MEKEFVTYTQAVALKELGFDEPCFGYYYTLNGKDWKFADEKQYDSLDEFYNIGSKFTISAPLYQQAFRWFREKYNLDKTIDSWTEQPMGDVIWDKAYQYYIHGEAYHPYFKTYEEAELACLIKLIELVKNK